MYKFHSNIFFSSAGRTQQLVLRTVPKRSHIPNCLPLHPYNVSRMLLPSTQMNKNGK